MSGQDDLRRIGAIHIPAVFCGEALAELEAMFGQLPGSRPGLRIAPTNIAGLIAVTFVQRIVARMLGPTTQPVRAILFDKRDGGNWALGWHQDRTIEVKHRSELPGYGPWTMKDGRVHVAPPIAVLEKMITARLHIDPVDADNAPLLIAPGSHREGRIAENRITEVVAAYGQDACLAAAGDVWLYATPILHASARSAPGRRRRVLQIDFAAEVLPGGLEWAGVA